MYILPVVNLREEKERQENKICYRDLLNSKLRTTSGIRSCHIAKGRKLADE